MIMQYHYYALVILIQTARSVESFLPFHFRDHSSTKISQNQKNNYRFCPNDYVTPPFLQEYYQQHQHHRQQKWRLYNIPLNQHHCSNRASMVSALNRSPTKRNTSVGINQTNQEKNDDDSILSSNNGKNGKANYQLLSILYAMLSLVLITMPNRITQYSNMPPFRYNTSLVSGSLGHAIASVVSLLLSKKSKIKKYINMDMDTSTSNILNVGLFFFSLFGFFAVPGEAAFYPFFWGSFVLFHLIVFTKCIGIVLSFRNIINTNVSTSILEEGENENMSTLQRSWYTIQQFYHSINSSITKTEPKTKDAKMYQSVLYVIFFICLGNHVMSLSNSYAVRNLSISRLNKSLHVSAIARLSLISSIVLSLVNASSVKDKINETPYIILNLTLGSWAFIVGIVEGVIDGSFVIRKSLSMLMLSWPFLYKGISSIRALRKRGDES